MSAGSSGKGPADRHDILVLGASAGGVEALTHLVRLLPANLPAAIFVVVHVPGHVTSLLPKIFSRSGPLPAEHPLDGAPIRHGRIYVAPPNFHLLIKQGFIHLARGPRENGHRPAVDPLFRSAALVYGSRVAGVVLSGSMDDGSVGLAAVKQRGGVAIVQSPDEALYPSMPRNALEAVAVDHVLPVAEIAPLLVRLASEPDDSVRGGGPVPEEIRREVEIDELRPGTPSGFGCPDCGGVLWELSGTDLFHFRCRVGHAWSATSLLAEQADAMEAALWAALRALEERASLAHRMSERMRANGSFHSAAHFDDRAREAQSSAEVIRGLILNAVPEPIPRESAAPASESGGAP